jgi:hypothetical protein
LGRRALLAAVAYRTVSNKDRTEDVRRSEDDAALVVAGD